MNDSAQKDVPWWRMNPLARFSFLLVAGLGFCLSAGLVSPGLLLQWFDPRSWPTWLIYPLWAAVCGRVIDLPCWSDSDRRIGIFLKPILVVLVLLLIVWHNDWYSLTFRRRVYSVFYSPFIIGPISQFLVDGSWNWRIFILPAAGVLALGFLLAQMVRLRKKKVRDMTFPNENRAGDGPGDE